MLHRRVDDGHWQEVDDPRDDRDGDETAEGDVHRKLGGWADPGSSLAALATDPSEGVAERVDELLRNWSQFPQKITQRAGDGVEGGDDCLNHGW